MNTYGVIMAGGGGTRFWPLSRERYPKQLLNLTGNGLMINETIHRLSNVIGTNNLFIVTNEKQGDQMKVAVGDYFAKNHIILEPSARNTAACIGYAAFEIIKKYGDGVMCIFPSDHYIKKQDEFENVLNKAISIANDQDKLVTIGIRPTHPSTGYGYINYDSVENSSFYEVNEFVEKPNLQVAKIFVESGRYAWNSGMFVWKVSTILQNFERFLPKVYKYLKQITDSICTPEEYHIIRQIYEKIPSISIDHGIMERSDNIAVIIGDFGWSDVGSWDSLGSIYDVDACGNVIKGVQINISTKNCISYAKNRLIATIGVENMIIVETDDSVLVCRKDQAQKVKEVVEQLKIRGLEQYLV